MKFAHRLTTCLLLLTVLACQKEDEVLSPKGLASNPDRTATTNLRLKQMLVSGNNNGLGPMFVNTYFTYTQGRNLEKVTIPTQTYAGVTTYLYTYDEQGRMTASRYLRETPDNNNFRGSQSNYKYTDSTIIETALRVDAEGNLSPYPTEPNYKITYRLNSEGLVYEELEEGAVVWGSETTLLRRYTYENGNIVKVETTDANGQSVSTLYYEYDDKVNPFYKWTYMFNAVLHCSRNNIVSARTSQSQPQRTEYTYNEQGLPLTKKNVTQGAVLTYDYETFDK